MDPQSQSFTPYSHTSEPWRLQSDIARVQQIQADHAERLARLERRQDDDARMKSVWGSSSPFPSVLSGTPQQAPLQQPAIDQFRNFDDEATQLMSSLHLDADDEPRRGLGATSRANSVRFDETANQAHSSHSSRPSMDFLSRTSSGLGGIQMTERTSSHKSDGRASSVHSFRSIASGRANSLNLDTDYGSGDANNSPPEMPALAPGLMLLGAVPAIIRCWMNTNFKHDALLYAAVCTGSYHSFLSLRLIQKLGFESLIRAPNPGSRTVELPMFFPEAVPHPASSRSSSPAPQLPSMTVEFRVLDDADVGTKDKSIQIFLGSDTLRVHNADILLSSNSMTVFDDDRHKLSIPLVRPENENVFNTLRITGEARPSALAAAPQAPIDRFNGGTGQESIASSSAATPPPPAIEASLDTTVQPSMPHPAQLLTSALDNEARPESRQSSSSRPSLAQLDTRSQAADPSAESASQPASARPSNSPAIWSNWRRDGSAASATSLNPSALDWANAGKNRDTYQRKEAGIRVLKPKTASRAFSTSVAPTSSGTSTPPDTRSRFFDEGRRRSGPDAASISRLPAAQVEVAKRENVPVTAAAQAMPASTASTAAPKSKSNPIGGASAFSWLNSGGGTK